MLNHQHQAGAAAVDSCYTIVVTLRTALGTWDNHHAPSTIPIYNPNDMNGDTFRSWSKQFRPPSYNPRDTRDKSEGNDRVKIEIVFRLLQLQEGYVGYP